MESIDEADMKRRAVQANNEVTCQTTMAMLSFRWAAHPVPAATLYAMPYNCLDAARNLMAMGVTSILVWPGEGRSGWWFWQR